MTGWLSLEHAAEAVLLFMLVEGFVLSWRYRQGRSSFAPWAIARILAPGIALVLAMRFGAGLPGTWAAFVSCLIAALIAHLIDLKARYIELLVASGQPPPLAGR